jgi:cell division septation protein DedD
VKMDRRTVSLLAIAGGVFLSAAVAGAQSATGRTPAGDAVFRRAIILVNDGEGDAGRAVLDSMVRVARPGSLEMAEALYWRATVAASAAEAEQDYKRVILDHPLSSRVPDALLRLAQLELARGDRENAIRRLLRLDIEYPGYPGRARTSYWLARAYLDQDDTARGCNSVAEARGRAAQNDVELRNQIDFLALRCPPPSVASAAPSPGGGTQQPPFPAQPPGTGTQATAPPQQSGQVEPAPEASTAPEPPPVVTEHAPAPAPPAAGPPPSAPAASSGSGVWSVQVAAFNTRAQANTLAQRLRDRGHQSRVDGMQAPFRVRIGRYPTRAAAASALQELKARGIDGFVTDVGTR